MKVLFGVWNISPCHSQVADTLESILNLKWVIGIIELEAIAFKLDGVARLITDPPPTSLKKINKKLHVTFDT